jgi:hypothetical protein
VSERKGAPVVHNLLAIQVLLGLLAERSCNDRVSHFSFW